jgi:ankyrin repeat protein
MEESKTKYVLGGIEISPRDQLAQVADLVLWAKDWIGDSVKASPEASVAWAGICIILPLLTNAKIADEANRDGFTYVTTRMHYYTGLEPLVEKLNKSDNTTHALAGTNEQVVMLYQFILEFQIQSILRFYENHVKRYMRDAVMSRDWSKMVANIEKLEKNIDRDLRQINDLNMGANLDSLNTSSTKSLEYMQQLLSVSEKQLRVAEEHRDIAQQLLSHQEDRVKRELSEKEEKCLQSFRLTSGDRDTTYEWYKNRVEERVQGTCQWFLDHDHFRTWLEQESGPLLVSADPGCGKSVLAKYLIDEALPRSTTICYFFFKDQDQSTVRQALCALLHQLFSQRRFLLKHAMAEYSSNGEKLRDATVLLWKILSNAIRDPEAGPIVMVLDALDECADSEFKDLIHGVKHQLYGKQTSSCKVKFLMTSRPYGQILSEFHDLLKDFPYVHIPGDEQSEVISQEINHVIETRVNQLDFPAHIREHLTKKMLETPHRTYLWVYLVFEHLQAIPVKKTKTAVESQIKTLPKNVNEAYERILNKSKDLQMTRRALAIMLAARRPLTLSEMNVAVNVENNHESFQDLDLEEDEDFKSTLRSWCGLFISIHHGKTYFLHQTAREFLLDLSPSTAVRSELSWHRSITLCNAHTVLAEQCIYHLNLYNSPESGGYIDSDAFLDYSANNWGIHLGDGHITADSSIASMVMRICDTDLTSYSTWSSIYWKAQHLEAPSNWSSIFVSSNFGLEAIVQLLVMSGKVNVDSKDDYGRTPLSYAAQHGHYNVMVQLMATGNVELDSKDNHGRTPLCYAAWHGQNAVVQHLLATEKVDVDAKDDFDRTPLLYAAQYGQGAVIQQLIATGKVDIESKDGFGQTSLLYAARYGHDNVMWQLLATEMVDVNSEDENCRTPLSYAAENGHNSIIQQLIATGKVDVNSKDEDGRTPLLYAAWYGHDTTVQQLAAIEMVDVDSKDNFGRTPFSYAAQYGHSAVIQQLIATGRVDVDSKDVYGRTPLSYAAENGHTAVVQLLVAMDKVDIDSKDENDRTPSSHAAEYEHDAVIQLLQRHRI